MNDQKTFASYHAEFPSVPVFPIYHMISDEDVSYVKHLYSYKNVKSFTADLDFFLKYYKPIDLTTLLISVKEKTELPKHSFLISFDDGFKELYDIVVPILKQKGIPATFFINKCFIDNKEMFYRNKASLLIEHFSKLTDQDQILLQEYRSHSALHS